LAKTSLSVLKRERQNRKRRLRNLKDKKALKGALKKLRSAKSKDEAQKLLPEVQSQIDKSTRKHLVHRNTARRLKSRAAREAADSD